MGRAAGIRQGKARGPLVRRAASVGRGGRMIGEAARGRWPASAFAGRAARRRDGESAIVEGNPAAFTLARDALFRRGLLVCDLASVALALVLATVVFPSGPSLLLALVTMPLLVLVNKLSGLYDRDELLLRRTTLEEAPDLFQAATVYSLVVGVGTRVLEPGLGGHEEVLAIWPTLFVSMLLTRASMRRTLNAAARPERCLVLGDANAEKRIVHALRRTSGASAQVVARMPIEATVELNATGVDGARQATELVTELTERRVDRVIVVPGSSDTDVLLDAVRVIKALGVKVSVVPQLFEVVGSSVSVDDIEGLLLLGVRRQGLTKSSHVLKRTFDIVVAGAGLLLLAPLLAMSSAVAAVASGASPLERHPRLTRDGRTFSMLSLRTDAGDARPAAWATAVRGFLRRSGLHALPRLVNVLRGELSLVGPRPQPPHADDALNRDGRSRFRGLTSPGLRAAPQDPDVDAVALRPGVTGLWRIDGDGSGAEDSELDYLYSSTWSVWLDVRLLLRSLALAGPPATPAVHAIRRLVDPGVAASPDPNSLTSRNGSAVSRGENGNARTDTPAAPLSTAIRLSVIVPATDSPPTLEPCLAALRSGCEPGDEIIVVDSCGTLGPAAARNEGAARSTGDVLVFVDADVVIHGDALARARAKFEQDPGLAATFGAYDDGLTSNGTVGTFRNLLHHHVHHSSAGEARTFWSGLGAVRQDAFLECDGFDERFEQASVEDIELGMRLTGDGKRIVLDPKIQGTHLKNWTLWEMIRTDFHRRGVPWVGLMLRARRLPHSLNLGWRHRLSAVGSVIFVGSVIARRPTTTLLATTGLVGLNQRLYRTMAARYGFGMGAAGVALHMLHHLVAVAALPVGILVYLRDRTAHQERGASTARAGHAPEQPPLPREDSPSPASGPQPFAEPGNKKRFGRGDGRRPTSIHGRIEAGDQLAESGVRGL